MSKVHSHVNAAVAAIKGYNGSLTLSNYLKKFFAGDKKYGSKDRKNISDLCYHYFRTGCALKNADPIQKIMAGLFLTHSSANEYIVAFAPGLNERINEPFSEKLRFLNIHHTDIFPLKESLTSELDQVAFIHSMLIQPKLFLRCRPKKKRSVIEKLIAAELKFETLEVDCIALANSVNAGNIIKINEEAVIQDKSSQQVLDYLSNFPIPKNNPMSAWDCCAASGGKSILLYDKLDGNILLTVSDIRDSILSTLYQRMKEAGITVHKSFITNLRNRSSKVDEQFDIVICDAPCTGSGTWSRTPEQILFFQKKKIRDYAEIQQNILLTIVSSVKPAGLLIYITCSVFIDENESQVKFISDHTGLQVREMRYIKGYNDYADTMFVAVFQKPA
jgi:16S rRNA (cytosine967-C5)-methyltransferase